MAKSPIQPYGELRQIAPNLYCMDGEWYDTPFRRRMTVVRLADGDLVVHSAFRLRDGDYGQLDSLGRVRYVIAPNTFHNSEAHFLKAHYPEAKILATPGAAKGIQKLHAPVDGLMPADWPARLKGELECLPYEGTRLLDECVFLHVPTRTLIVTDLVFNMRGKPGGITGAIFRLNRIEDRFGPSRIFRYVFVNRPDSARESLRRICEWDFDRVVMSHGQVLESGGKAAMRRGFAEMGLA